MDLELAETIVEACELNGVRVELKKNYSASWMRGKKTTGVVILDGDLAQVLAAIISKAQLFTDDGLAKFEIKNKLFFSPFRLSLILY